MRIVCISDTHTHHVNMKHEVPDGDLLLFAGDLMSCGYWEGEINDFCHWFDSHPHKNKVFIPGNHDRLFESSANHVKELVDAYPNLIYLNNTSCVIDGVKIFGSPWTPWFHSWAFNFPNPYYGEPTISIPKAREAAIACWDLVPDDTDIVITHGPPRGILDLVFYDKENVGCPHLLERIMKVKPALHLFGHIHETYGTHVENDIIFANASICNLGYKPVNKPLVFDFDHITGSMVEVL